MRKSCYDCARKHLAQALVISMELRYYSGDLEDDHLWVCIGHLAEAADQIQRASPFVADKIRDQRLLLMNEGPGSVNKLDINGLIHMVTDLHKESQAAKHPVDLGKDFTMDEIAGLDAAIRNSDGSV